VSKLGAIAISLLLTGCLSVRQEDLAAWVGQPVELLDTQPFFLTIPMTKTVTAGGTEIRNYANTRTVSSCTSGGSVYAGLPNFATVNGSSSCATNTMGCNNLFYIRDGKVLRYQPVSSGGVNCVTDDRVLPQRI
jgi:hypothetical protein